MSVSEIAYSLLEAKPLCDNCFGRQFALLGHGLTNQERGKAIKLFLTFEGHRLVSEGDTKGFTILKTLANNGLFFDLANQILSSLGVEIENPLKNCHLCEGRFEYLDELAERIVDKLSRYEHSSFLIGVRLPLYVEEKEDEIRAEFNIKWGENIRSEFSRELGKIITKLTSVEVDFRRPDILVIVNPYDNQLKLHVNSIFIKGRYRKLVRGIPQSRWLCQECQGQGCAHCKETGKKYPESVEELISELILKATKGVSEKFHAAGREDIDARVLGEGRPFIVEVFESKIRKPQLDVLRREINCYASSKVEVSELSFSSKSSVQRMKASGQSEKSYRALIEFGENVFEKKLKEVENTLNGAIIMQSTPLRVMHRRADKVREKHIYKLKLTQLEPKKVELYIRCQGGLYVKELISGDGGRTKPSISGLSETTTKCLELDVLEVSLKEF